MKDKNRQELEDFFKRNGLKKCNKFYSKHINLHKYDVAKILGVNPDFFTSDTGQLSFLYPPMFSCSMFGIPGFYQFSSFENLLELREIIKEYFQEQEQPVMNVDSLKKSKQKYVTKKELTKILDCKLSSIKSDISHLESKMDEREKSETLMRNRFYR